MKTRVPSGRFAAAVALSVAVAAISWASILVRLCEAPSLGIAYWRLLFSVLVLLPWGLRRGTRVSGSTYMLAAAAGILLGLHFATWIASLAFTTVASSVVLVSTQPVFTAVLGPLVLGERAGRTGWFAILLALTGTAVLAGGDWRLGTSALVGDMLALAGAVTASGYFMIGRRVRERIPFGHYLLLVYAVAAATVGLLAIGSGAALSGYPRLTWLWLVLLAAGPNLMGHGLLNWSVRRLRALAVNVAVLGEPVLATLYAALLLREIPPLPFYPGAVLIVAGIVLTARSESALARMA